MTWNLTGNIQGPGSSGLTIYFNADPTSPANGEMWIREETSVAGQATGMMGITYANTSAVFSDTLSIKLINRTARIVL